MPYRLHQFHLRIQPGSMNLPSPCLRFPSNTHTYKHISHHRSQHIPGCLSVPQMMEGLRRGAVNRVGPPRPPSVLACLLFLPPVSLSFSVHLLPIWGGRGVNINQSQSASVGVSVLGTGVWKARCLPLRSYRGGTRLCYRGPIVPPSCHGGIKRPGSSRWGEPGPSAASDIPAANAPSVGSSRAVRVAEHNSPVSVAEWFNRSNLIIN